MVILFRRAMTVSRGSAKIHRDSANPIAPIFLILEGLLAPPPMPTRSTDPDAYQSVPRPVAAMAKRFADGHRIPPHCHLGSQFVHAVSGVMTVETERGTWVVPPDRALWLPAGVRHAIGMAGSVDMRTLYIRQDASACLPEDCVVLGVTPLLRELIVRATEWPILYDEDGPAAAVMGLILAEIAAMPALPLHLPMPTDRRLIRVCRRVQADLAGGHSREAAAHGVGLSGRSLSRLFRMETGLGFSEWRQQARLLAALSRLAAGESVTSVALGLGYASPSAFTAMFRRALGTTPAACRSRAPGHGTTVPRP